MTSTYVFLDAHLVRAPDGHMLAWDTEANTPLNPEEEKLWRAAGSPIPAAGTLPRTVTPAWPIVPPRPFARPLEPAWVDPNAAIQRETLSELEKIKAALAALAPDDIAGLKTHVERLTSALCAMLAAQAAPAKDQQ